MADKDKPSIAAPAPPVPTPTDPAGGWDGLSPPQVELPADALSKLAESAAAGRRAYDAMQDAKRNAGGISDAPAPPPSLLENNHSPKPPEHPPRPDGSLREDFERGVEELEPPKAATAASHKFSLDDMMVFVASECFAVPLNIAAGEAFVGGHFDRALLGWGLGVPLGILGFTFHWWKGYLSAPKREWIKTQAARWWAVPLLLAFAYVAGPEVYRRATKPIAVTGAIGAMPRGQRDVEP